MSFKKMTTNNKKELSEKWETIIDFTNEEKKEGTNIEEILKVLSSKKIKRK